MDAVMSVHNGVHVPHTDSPIVHIDSPIVHIGIFASIIGGHVSHLDLPRIHNATLTAHSGGPTTADVLMLATRAVPVRP